MAKKNSQDLAQKLNRVFIVGVEYDVRNNHTPHRFNIGVIARIPGTDDGKIQEVGRVTIPKNLRPLVGDDLQEYISRVVLVSHYGLSKKRTLKNPKFVYFDDNYPITECLLDYTGDVNNEED